MGHHGVALYNHDRQLMWGYAMDKLQLPVGEHDFCYTFPMLPLRPGSYTWLVTRTTNSNSWILGILSPKWWWRRNPSPTSWMSGPAF
jgi:hypothetical protein